MKELKIKIDETEITKLMKVFGTSDENEAVKLAIDLALKKQAYDQILALRGNVSWEGNLDEMREQRI